MIRSDNLRAAYMQSDVDEYIYNLLPKNDPVVAEMEEYAEANRVPIIGPLRGCSLCWCKFRARSAFLKWVRPLVIRRFG